MDLKTSRHNCDIWKCRNLARHKAEWKEGRFTMHAFLCQHHVGVMVSNGNGDDVRFSCAIKVNKDENA